MKTKKRLILLIPLILMMLLTACAGRSSMVASGWASVTADENTAYLAFNTQIIAVNLANGTEVWRYPAEAEANITFYAPPVLTEDGQLIAGSYNHVLYSLNPQNGQLNWKFEGATGRYIDSPLVTSTNIFAPSADHNLYALSLNGQSIWPRIRPVIASTWARWIIPFMPSTPKPAENAGILKISAGRWSGRRRSARTEFYTSVPSPRK